MESLFHKWLSNDRVGYVFTGCDPKLQLVTVAISKIGRQSYPEKKKLFATIIMTPSFFLDEFRGS